MQQEMHKGFYDQRSKASELVVSEKTTQKGEHKIPDRWEDKDCEVIVQPTLIIHAYEIQIWMGVNLWFSIRFTFAFVKVA